MNGLPWVKFYSSDWLAGTSGLSAAERGVYITICALIYEHNGPVQIDEARLGRRCGCTKGAFRKILKALVDEGKLTISGGAVSNRRCEDEIAERQKFSEKQRENANQRWHEKNKKTVKKQGTGNAKAMPKVCQPEPEPDKVKRKPTVSQKNGCRLPDDWLLPKAWGEWAVDLGLTPDAVRNEADKFRDYWHSLTGRTATKLDWFATWRNWCRKAQADQQRYSQHSNRRGDTNGQLAKIHGWFADTGLDSDPGSVVARSELPDDGRCGQADDPDGLGVGPVQVPEAHSRTGIHRSSPGVAVSAEACGDHQPSFLTVIDGTGGRW